MAKKTRRTGTEFFIDGKPALLSQIAEASSDENVWKSHLEEHELHHSTSADRYLRSKLGEYLSAHEIQSSTGTKPSTFEGWRKSDNVRAEKLKGRWYYSLQSVLEAIKYAK